MLTPIVIGQIKAVTAAEFPFVAVSAVSIEGAPLIIKIPVDQIQLLAPELLEAASIIALYDHWPPTDTPIGNHFIRVLDAAGLVGKDTQQPFLRVHTDGGTLRLVMPSGVAERCGKELQVAGIQAAAPPPDRQH